jgi:hypothetical protein
MRGAILSARATLPLRVCTACMTSAQYFMKEIQCVLYKQTANSNVCGVTVTQPGMHTSCLHKNCDRATPVEDKNRQLKAKGNSP